MAHPGIVKRFKTRSSKFAFYRDHFEDGEHDGESVPFVAYAHKLSVHAQARKGRMSTALFANIGVTMTYDDDDSNPPIEILRRVWALDKFVWREKPRALSAKIGECRH